jgi:hypothetical protein
MPNPAVDRTPEHDEYFSDISGKYLDNISKSGRNLFLNNCHLLAVTVDDMHTLHKRVHKRSLTKATDLCNYFIRAYVCMFISERVDIYMGNPCKLYNHSCVNMYCCVFVSFLGAAISQTNEMPWAAMKQSQPFRISFLFKIQIWFSVAVAIIYFLCSRVDSK